MYEDLGDEFLHMHASMQLRSRYSTCRVFPAPQGPPCAPSLPLVTLILMFIARDQLCLSETSHQWHRTVWTPLPPASVTPRGVCALRVRCFL